MTSIKKVENYVYKQRYERLKLIHDFSFDGRAFSYDDKGTVKINKYNKDGKKVIGQRKGIITKLWNQYKDVIKKLEDNVYTPIKATKSQRKHFRGQYETTNKVIIYNKKADSGTVRKTEIIGKGRDMQLMDDIKIKHAVDRRHAHKFTFYLPFPETFSQLHIDDYIELINAELKPDFVSIAINGFAGSKMITPFEFSKYKKSLTRDIKAHGGKGRNKIKTIITGMYLIFFKNRLNKQWLKELKEKVIKFQSQY